MTDSDVVIVGGGFAGLAAARELTRRGRSAVLLEARERLGGRTWTAERLGVPLELGGAHVHWSQPYMWGEIERYDLEVTPNAHPDRVSLFVDGTLRMLSVQEWGAVVERLQTAAFAQAKHLFPLPFDPLRMRSEVQQADGFSAADHLASLGMGPVDHSILTALWSVHVSGDPLRASKANALRAAALAEGQIGTYLGVVTGYNLKDGTGALVHRMAADTDAEIRLESPVSTIEERDDTVIVTLASGESVRSRAAVVTAPLTTLRSIRFEPELAVHQRRAIDRGQVSTGLKVWIRIREDVGPWFAVAAAPSPVQILHRDQRLPDGSGLLHAFGADHALLDVNDLAAIQRAVDRVLPDSEVLEATSHDWVSDPYSRETWPLFPKGGFVQGFEALCRPHGRVRFAGSLLARGWTSFIDGALETGIRSARRVDQALR